MKITEVKTVLCHGAFRTWTLVKVTTDEGLIGWGDATEWVRAQAHKKVIEEDLSPLVIGEDPFDIEKLWQKMWIASYVGGKDLSVAMTGIETALWDIVGKALNTPVYNLLGGRCFDRLRLYYDFCDSYGGGLQGGTKNIEGDSTLEGVAKQAAYIKRAEVHRAKNASCRSGPSPSDHPDCFTQGYQRHHREGRGDPRCGWQRRRYLYGCTQYFRLTILDRPSQGARTVPTAFP